MKKTLKKYIQSYIKESTIPYKASDIDASLQNQLTLKKHEDMTKLPANKTLEILAKEAGPNTFISFVEGSGNIVSGFDVNPTAKFNTPHGNYGYLLTKDNLKSLVETFSIDGVTFAMNRKYILIYKITSPDAIYIEKDGSCNYAEYRFFGDVEKVARAFYHYLYSYYYSKSKADSSKKELNADQKRVYQDLKINSLRQKAEDLKTISKSQLKMDDVVTEIKDCLQGYFSGLDDFFRDSKSSDIRNLNDNAIEILRKYLTVISNKKESNRYIEMYPGSGFHKLYTICYILSKVSEKIKYENALSKGQTPDPYQFNSGPIFSLLLKEANIDAVIDKGSSTIHENEPQQAFVTHFGSEVQRENIEFIGTFKNIFNVANYNPQQKENFSEQLLNIYHKNLSYMPDTPTTGYFSSASSEPITEDENMIDKVKSKIDHLNSGDDVFNFPHFLVATDDIEFDEGIKEWEFFVECNYKANLNENDMFFFHNLIHILNLPIDHKINLSLDVDIFYDQQEDITQFITTMLSSKYFSTFQKWQKVSDVFLTFKINQKVKLYLNQEIYNALLDLSNVSIEMSTQSPDNRIDIIPDSLSNLMLFINKVELSTVYKNSMIHLNKFKESKNLSEYSKLSSEISKINPKIQIVQSV